ncbi:immune inhibitor A domain-containing protein [Micromonospora globispora]|uniref:immune inhibitor A domain-containing protein n=1 Tax=Micromonospora globispora TaxID=1450148 RepID=UPI0024341735|nr:immune inhibitor A domain-containing protein [Micromonospora globispora]
MYTIWAGGYTIPGINLKVSNYIVQPEDVGVGVFAHEFGHDLGLPNLYDTSGNADSDVDFWDPMASGSHSGEIFQALPTRMGLWDKWVLGWADPLTVTPGADSKDVQLGQTSNTPVGTKDGIKVDLPNKVITLAEPHNGANMWYSGADLSGPPARRDTRRGPSGAHCPRRASSSYAHRIQPTLGVTFLGPSALP